MTIGELADALNAHGLLAVSPFNHNRGLTFSRAIITPKASYFDIEFVVNGQLLSDSVVTWTFPLQLICALDLPIEVRE